MTTSSPAVLSVNVGQPQELPWRGRLVRTAFLKQPVDGAVEVTPTHLVGDAVGDLSVHGGPSKALYLYPHEYYAYWNARLGADFGPGSFGENLTTVGLDENEISIGDRLQIGSAVFRVTEPRTPCYKLAVRFRRPDFPAEFVRAGRFGFYLAVDQPGVIRAAEPIAILDRHPARLTVNQLIHLRASTNPRDCDDLLAAAEVGALPTDWRQSLRDLADRLRSSPVDRSSQQLRVAGHRLVNSAVAEILLEDPESRTLRSFIPGQFITIEVQTPTQVAPRNYSLCSAPGSSTYRLLVRRGDGPGSAAIHDSVRAGDRLRCSAPSGGFVLPASPSKVVMIAGGIGITPFLSMVSSAGAAVTASIEITLIHSVRSATDLLDEAELRRLADTNSWFSYQPWLSGESGRLSIARDLPQPLDREASYLVCGSTNFVTDIVSALRDSEVPADRITSEGFSTLGPETFDIEIPENGLYVGFLRSSIFSLMTEPGNSLLDHAEQNAVPIPSACRVGACGTCRTRIKSGVVSHRGTVAVSLADDECLPCIAVPVGPEKLFLDA